MHTFCENEAKPALFIHCLDEQKKTAKSHKNPKREVAHTDDDSIAFCWKPKLLSAEGTLTGLCLRLLSLVCCESVESLTVNDSNRLRAHVMVLLVDAFMETNITSKTDGRLKLKIQSIYDRLNRLTSFNRF